MRKYYIRGKSEIRLSDADFKGQGGQAVIYAQGSTAYKIYTDRISGISEAKIAELSVLDSPNIIRPLDVLVDDSGNLAGYSMRYIDRGYLLCQLFPAAFRNRHNLTPDGALQVVRKLQNGVGYVHSKGILIVDLNEMNLMVSADLRDAYFLDVDSYQTPSFPATAIMDSVRDRHASQFDRSTDWFAFAIVSFQVFTGLHPYKGNYPPFTTSVDKSLMLDARMKANISVLHAGVAVPPACLPFDVIPPVYLAWYRATFEYGARQSPPGGPVDSITLRVMPQPAITAAGVFSISPVLELDSDIVERFSEVILTRKSIYLRGKRFDRPAAAQAVALTPRSARLIALWLEGDRVQFLDVLGGLAIDAEVKADEIIAIEGRVYLKRETDLMELEFIELSSRVLIVPRTVGHVLKNATQLFEGVVFQNLLGGWYGSFLPEPFTCYQTRVKELDGYTIVDARCEKNVLIVIAARSGRYDRFTLRLGRDFSSYDIRSQRDADNAGINFTVLDNGICLSLGGEDLELFRSRPGDDSLELVPAREFGDIRLFHQGTQALFARNNKLFKFSLTQ
jgi:serine/threonine protein kinase